MQKLEKKYFSRHKEPLAPMPNLVEIQTKGYEWIRGKGLEELLQEFFPISDYTGKKFELSCVGFSIDEPQHDEYFAKAQKINYETPLRIRLSLKNKTLGTDKEQELFLTDLPIMTDHGTFIVSGNERVMVPQISRSFGVIFNSNIIKGYEYFGAKIIPSRGAWLEIEVETNGAIYGRIDKKRKFPITSLLRSLTTKSDDEIKKDFNDLEDKAKVKYLANTFAQDPAQNRDEALLEVYSKLRDGEHVTSSSADEFITNLFSSERFDMSHVGRFRFNQRFGLPTDEKTVSVRNLSYEDLSTILRHIIEMNEDADAKPDDIDSLYSRRVRNVGEMMQQKLRLGMAQMKRNIQDKMSTVDINSTMPLTMVNTRSVQARVKEFFTTNQLSQFMGQENILTEVEHLRRMSALGPGGLTRERAGYDVRDVHPSHYGRVCPIQTPEGPNIGLILNLATFARVNDLGVIESPYAVVKNGKITDSIVYLNALDESKAAIAHGATPYSSDKKISVEEVEVRRGGTPIVVSREEVEYIDIAPNQAFSIATSMIPFLEHDDANRALMGSNMQKQATPCIVPEAPLVATGVEADVAKYSGRLVYADEAGEVVGLDARKIIVKNQKGKDRRYEMRTFARTNAVTALHHRPTVNLGDNVKKGQLLADTSTTVSGEVAIGQNALVAFMSWGGSNFEDAIIISERLVKESKFTTIHIEEFVCNVRDTRLGPEQTTADIPNVGDSKLRNLDEEGIIRVGAEVSQGDILVGKITPKGETELTPEERLLRSIFGEKARDVKDSSVRVEHGKQGRIVGVKIFSRDNGDKLESGIIKKIYIEVAQLRNVSVGDKLSGRHGNKGVISRILPEEDMPYMADGTPVDVILTPLGVPSRMNLGQILEIHLGMAANTLGYQAITPTFIGATNEEVMDELEKAGFSRDGKVVLYDGQSGEAFEQPVSAGYMYMLKLHHMVEDKIHMRSIGPYSLITQQPLGGRSQGGGQRFGEMEVWALEGYGAAHILREVLTIKSDDILGRSAAFDSIVKGEDISQINIPASFNVLLNELRGLALDVELKKLDDNQDG